MIDSKKKFFAFDPPNLKKYKFLFSGTLLLM